MSLLRAPGQWSLWYQVRRKPGVNTSEMCMSVFDCLSHVASMLSPRVEEHWYWWLEHRQLGAGYMRMSTGSQILRVTTIMISWKVRDGRDVKNQLVDPIMPARKLVATWVVTCDVYQNTFWIIKSSVEWGIQRQKRLDELPTLKPIILVQNSL